MVRVLLAWALVFGCGLLLAQNPCSTVTVAPSSDHAFAVGSSDTGGAYQWTLDGKTIQFGASSQTFLLHADESLKSPSGAQPVKSSNVSFQGGRWGQALAVESGGSLTYSSQYPPLD